MKNIRVAPLLMLMILAFLEAPSFAAVNWSNIGPSGTGDIVMYDVAVDPTDANRVYILMLDQTTGHYLLYRSTDGGNNWIPEPDSESSFGDESNRPYKVYVSPSSPEVLYVAAGSGIWKGIQYGSIWSLVTSEAACCLAFSASKEVIYFSGTKDSVYAGYGAIAGVTTDEGATWHAIRFGNGFEILTFSNHLTAHPTLERVALASGAIFASTPAPRGDYWGGIYMTTNEARSFVRKADISYHGVGTEVTTGPILVGIHFNKANPSEVVAMARPGQDAAKPRVFISSDGGETFVSHEASSFSPGFEQAIFGSFLVDPENFNRKYFGYQGIWVSTDPTGETWAESWSGFPGKPNVQAMEVSVSSPEVLYSVTDYGVWKSTNKGNSWISMNSYFTSSDVGVFRVPEGRPQRVYAFVRGGRLAVTDDFGSTWLNGESVYNGQPNLKVAPSNYDILCSTPNYSKEFLKSGDGGYSFADTPLDAPLTTSEKISVFAIDPSTAETIYCQIQSSTTEAANPRLLKTTDGGGSWSTLVSGINEQARLLVISPLSPEVIYRSGYYNPYPGWSVKKSINGGSSWVDLSANFPTSPITVAAMAIDKVDPKNLYVGIDGRGTNFKIYGSTNEGQSFTLLGGIPYPNYALKDLVVNPVRNNILYALIATGESGADKIYRSTDRGASWALVSAVDPANSPDIIQIDINPKADMLLYAGTDQGVYAGFDTDVPSAPSIEALTPRYLVNLSGTNMRIDGRNLISPYLKRVHVRRELGSETRALTDFTVVDPLTMIVVIPPRMLTGTYALSVEAEYPSSCFSNILTFEVVGTSPSGPTIEAVKFDGRTYVGPTDPISSTPIVTARIKDVDGINRSGFEYILINKDTTDWRRTTIESTAFTPGGITTEGILNFQVSPYISSGRYDLMLIARDRATTDAYPEGNVGAWMGTVEVNSGAPQVIGLVMSYPQPYKPIKGVGSERTLTIAYNLTRDAAVTVYVYDISGRLVLTRKFGSGVQGGHAGYNQFQWNGRTDLGGIVGNGIYVIKVVSGNKSLKSGKIVVLD